MCEGHSREDVTITIAFTIIIATVVLFEEAILNVLLRVGTLVRSQHQLVLEVSMLRRKDSDDGRLLKSEAHLVAKVVPQVINAESLLVVEVLLLALGTEQITRSVQRGRELLDEASLNAATESKLRRHLLDFLRSDEELIVGAPLGLQVATREHSLEEPDSEVGTWRRRDSASHLVV